jgi:hypothetical protein
MEKQLIVDQLIVWLDSCPQHSRRPLGTPKKFTFSDTRGVYVEDAGYNFHSIAAR